MSRRWAIWMLALWGLGCHHTQQAIRELQRENFLLGEQITQLEVLLSDYELALRQCRRKLREGKPGEEETAPSPSVPQFQPPEVELGQPQSSSGGQKHWPRLEPALPRHAQSAPSRPGRAVSRKRYAGSQNPSSGTVARIFFHPEETLAVDTDGDEVADLIQVGLMAQDPHHRAVVPQGQLALAVVDHSGSFPVRLARWDYSPEAVRLHVVQTDQGPMLLLRMHWEGPLPKQENLRLYARLITPQGRRLQAQTPVKFPLGTSQQDDSVALSSGGSPAPRLAHPEGKSSTWAAAGSFAWRSGTRRPESPIQPRHLVTSPAPGPSEVSRPQWRPWR